MKRIIAVILMMLCFTTLAFAEGGKHRRGGNGSSSGSSANVAVDVSGGGSVNESESAPTVAPPALAASSAACMGSTSLGGSWAVAGFAIGTTWKDEECIRERAAARIQSLGFRDAAKEIMCGNPEVYMAMQVTGHPCKIEPAKATVKPGGTQSSDRILGIK